MTFRSVARATEYPVTMKHSWWTIILTAPAERGTDIPPIGSSGVCGSLPAGVPRLNSPRGGVGEKTL